MRFAVCLTTSNLFKRETVTHLDILEASSKEEAIGKVMLWAYKEYPLEAGWENYLPQAKLIKD